jgi:alpha-acetolactate decarboxylase
MVHRDHENDAGTNKLDATRQAPQFLHGSNAYLAVGSSSGTHGDRDRTTPESLTPQNRKVCGNGPVPEYGDERHPGSASGTRLPQHHIGINVGHRDAWASVLLSEVCGGIGR